VRLPGRDWPSRSGERCAQSSVGLAGRQREQTHPKEGPAALRRAFPFGEAVDGRWTNLTAQLTHPRRGWASGNRATVRARNLSSPESFLCHIADTNIGSPPGAFLVGGAYDGSISLAYDRLPPPSPGSGRWRPRPELSVGWHEHRARTDPECIFGTRARSSGATKPTTNPPPAMAIGRY